MRKVLYALFALAALCSPVLANISYPTTGSSIVGVFSSVTSGGIIDDITTTTNAVLTVNGLQSSGTGSGIRLRDSINGTNGYIAMNSYVQGGTAYTQIDLQAAQGTGTVCISGGGLGSSTAGTSCGILVTATNQTNLTGPIKLMGYTVAGLPAGTIGASAYVTDATACTFLVAPTGGGATFCPVIYNGASWIAN